MFSVSNLALVKPEKAKAVENYLIQMARLGQLGAKVRRNHSDDLSSYIGWLSSMCLHDSQSFGLPLKDFRVWFDWDFRKSESTNRKKDDSQSKFDSWHLCLVSTPCRTIYCLHFSSTDGELWTQMMMMITNHQMEPWNWSDMDMFYWSPMASLTSCILDTSEFWHL